MDARAQRVCVRVCALCVHASLLESSIVWGPHQIASIFGVVAAPSQCMRQKPLVSGADGVTSSTVL